ncbi:Uncharacterised protein [Mycobacteroides abscessus subsp. abscessus]|nr:Uncharacterised protein [Mycobacteroides abscessus subsp. abscessus]
MLVVIPRSVRRLTVIPHILQLVGLPNQIQLRLPRRGPIRQLLRIIPNRLQLNISTPLIRTVVVIPRLIRNRHKTHITDREILPMSPQNIQIRTKIGDLRVPIQNLLTRISHHTSLSMRVSPLT